MKGFGHRRLAGILFFVVIATGLVAAKRQPQSAPPAQSQPYAQQAQPVNPDAAASGELSAEGSPCGRRP